MKITKETIQNVFRSKKGNIETLELQGYRLVKELFFDNSGLSSERGLTTSALSDLETILKENPVVYTFLTSIGQLQVYIGVFIKVKRDNPLKRTANKRAIFYINSLQEFKANNIFAIFEGLIYKVYSYGKHFPIFAYDTVNFQWYENIQKYSVSTSKHQTQCRLNVEYIPLITKDLIDLN